MILATRGTEQILCTPYLYFYGRNRKGWIMTEGGNAVWSSVTKQTEIWYSYQLIKIPLIAQLFFPRIFQNFNDTLKSANRNFHVKLFFLFFEKSRDSKYFKVQVFLLKDATLILDNWFKSDSEQLYFIIKIQIRIIPYYFWLRFISVDVPCIFTPKIFLKLINLYFD